MVLTPCRAQINCCMKEFKILEQPTVEITTIHGSQGIHHIVTLEELIALQVESVML